MTPPAPTTTTDTETINGHLYTVTRDAGGNILTMVGADPLPPLAAPPIIAQAQALVAALKAGTATALQQQQAVAIVLAMLLRQNTL